MTITPIDLPWLRAEYGDLIAELAEQFNSGDVGIMLTELINSYSGMTSRPDHYVTRIPIYLAELYGQYSSLGELMALLIIIPLSDDGMDDLDARTMSAELFAEYHGDSADQRFHEIRVRG